jgi:hypothetical protein
MEKSIKRLNKEYGITPSSFRKVTTVVIKASALFGAEVWWYAQKGSMDEIQVMFNQQARAITSYMKTTPIAPLIVEARIIPAMVFLDNKQRQYTKRLVGPPQEHQARAIILESILKEPLRGAKDDEEYHPVMRPRRQPTGPRSQEFTDIGPQLSKHLKPSINPQQGIKEIWLKGDKINGTVINQAAEMASKATEAVSKNSGNLFTDGSHLKNG